MVFGVGWGLCFGWVVLRLCFVCVLVCALVVCCFGGVGCFLFVGLRVVFVWFDLLWVCISLGLILMDLFKVGLILFCFCVGLGFCLACCFVDFGVMDLVILWLLVLSWLLSGFGWWV